MFTPCNSQSFLTDDFTIDVPFVVEVVRPVKRSLTSLVAAAMLDDALSTSLRHCRCSHLQLYVERRMFSTAMSFQYGGTTRLAHWG